MGYSVTGSIKITTTDTVMAAVALDLDSLRSEAKLGSFRTTDDLVVDLLAHHGFEDIHIMNDTDDPEQTVRIAWISTRWIEGIDETFSFLARHGAAVSGEFRGEDDSLWMVSSELGGHALREENLIPVPASELANYRLQAATLQQIRERLEREGLDINVPELIQILSLVISSPQQEACLEPA